MPVPPLNPDPGPDSYAPLWCALGVLVWLLIIIANYLGRNT